MPRDIPVGNGQMLVGFDQHYQIRDVYFPHVGLENHTGGVPFRFGVYGDLPRSSSRDRRRQRCAWTSDTWHVELGYRKDTLTTDVHLHHDDMALRMDCQDVVDFHRNLLVRRITLTNEHDQPRQVRVYHHHDFHILGTKVGDTAYYDPRLRMIVHYRENRYFMAGFYSLGELRLDQYATGNSGFGGAEGTWRDAEDGELGGNAIAQGAVDSTIGIDVFLPAAGEIDSQATVYLLLGVGASQGDLVELHRFLHREGPQGVIDRTSAYWRLWCWSNDLDFDGLEDEVVDLYRRSLLVLRTQIDNNGAIIAANDSDIMQFSRDTYSYMWPRDGALVASVLDAAGYHQVTRRFYDLCSRILSDGGYFLHKYNPDGSPASSWHPWVVAGRSQLPIQEDETALVLWALWQHFYLYRDIEFVRPLWMRLIEPAADFMLRFRDPATNLPLPSYDLWEERWGIHAFTVASVYAGLTAAANFAVCFGDRIRATRYRTAAQQMQKAFCADMWCEKQGRFLRRIEPLDTGRIGRIIEHAASGRDPARANGWSDDTVEMYRDEVIDSSLFGIYKFRLLDVDDPRVEATMQAVEKRLWVKTPVGGAARYEEDHYHRVTDNTRDVPGNPWFICTLWLADWHIARAQSVDELRRAEPILRWVVNHKLPSGCLAEQVHPQTNAPLSVSPLTWSHATMVGCVVDYLDKLAQLTDDGEQRRKPSCPISHGPRHIGDELIIERYRAYRAADADAPETQSP